MILKPFSMLTNSIPQKRTIIPQKRTVARTAYMNANLTDDDLIDCFIRVFRDIATIQKTIFITAFNSPRIDTIPQTAD